MVQQPLGTAATMVLLCMVVTISQPLLRGSSQTIQTKAMLLVTVGLTLPAITNNNSFQGINNKGMETHLETLGKYSVVNMV